MRFRGVQTPSLKSGWWQSAPSVEGCIPSVRMEGKSQGLLLRSFFCWLLWLLYYSCTLLSSSYVYIYIYTILVIIKKQTSYPPSPNFEQDDTSTIRPATSGYGRIPEQHTEDPGHERHPQGVSHAEAIWWRPFKRCFFWGATWL
jgi:hypothetical protein